jgi:hypothetical protein
MNNMSAFRALIENRPYTKETRTEYFQTRANQVKEWMLANNNTPVSYRDILNNLNLFTGESEEASIALCGNLMAFMSKIGMIESVPYTSPRKMILKNT